MTYKSVTFKFLAILLIASIIFGASAFLLFSAKVGISFRFFFFGLLLYALFIFAIFLLFFAAPLFRIVQQIKFLLTGKKYRRITPKAADEIGLITHFFNKITLSLESISGDILEKKRLASEFDVAQKIQNDILPKKAPAIIGLDIVARSRPAAEVGGDSFDFIQQDTQTMIYIGDVTGHGVPAGLVMMVVNTLIHAFAKHNMYPYEILTQVNSILFNKVSAEQFMSLLMMRWDEKKQKMYYLGAGHEYILIYRAAEKTVERIPSGGIALRMAENIEDFIEEKQIHLNDNDVILLYSDGITEGRNPQGEMFAIDRLERSLKNNGFRSTAEKIFDAITNEFSDFIGEYVQQEDDITMIVVKKLTPDQNTRTPIKLSIGRLENANYVSKKKRWDWE